MRTFVERPHHLDNISQLAPEKEFSLIKSSEYAAHLLDAINRATHRIWLQTMNLENDHMVGLVFHNLGLKAQEGLDVRFNVDGFSRMVTDGHLHVTPVLSKTEFSFRIFRRNTKKHILQLLTTSNVIVTETNWPVQPFRYFFPPVGRNHIKIALIDNVGFLGGINLCDKDLLREDTMLRITNPQVVQGLEDAFRISSKSGQHQSAILAETEFDQLLFDGGKHSESLILAKATEIILAATDSVSICTQFAPDSFISRILTAVRKKNKTLRINLVVSNPDYITEDNAWWFDRFDRIRAQMQNIPMQLFPGWLHAKIIAVDLERSWAKAIYGTHNFVEKGSKWGNEELSLYTENPEVLSQINLYLSTIISASKHT